MPERRRRFRGRSCAAEGPSSAAGLGDRRCSRSWCGERCLGGGPPRRRRRLQPPAGRSPSRCRGTSRPGSRTSIDLTKAFTKQYPNVKWNVREDPFATITQNAPLTLSGPESAGPHAAAAGRRAGQGPPAEEPRRVLQAYDWSTFPASQLAQLRTPAAGRRAAPGRSGRWVVNYSLTGVFYNKTLAAKIGMTERAEDAGPARRAAREGEGRGDHADRAVQRRRDRRAAVSAAAADGGLRLAEPDQQLDLRQAGRDHQHAVEPGRRRRTCSVDQGRLLQLGRQRHRLPDDDEQVRARRGPAHLRRRLGVRELRQR